MGAGAGRVLLVGLSRTWQRLFPGLLIYSFAAYCLPVINAYLTHAVGGRNLERTFTTVFVAYATGGLVSPAVGGWLTFGAMYLGFPLSPNFLADVWRWDVARIGTLGSFQALGTELLGLAPGRLADGHCARGLVVGQALVWCSALLLLLTSAFPALALAYLLRGAFLGCTSLTRARATALGDETERGLLLGATDTIVAAAQVVAPYVAGWLYGSNPAYPSWLRWC